MDQSTKLVCVDLVVKEIQLSLHPRRCTAMAAIEVDVLASSILDQPHASSRMDQMQKRLPNLFE